jgi:hypothetical protein
MSLRADSPCGKAADKANRDPQSTVTILSSYEWIAAHDLPNLRKAQGKSGRNDMTGADSMQMTKSCHCGLDPQSTRRVSK